MEYHPQWNLSKWLTGLHAGMIRIITNIVVLYFEQIELIPDVPPLKNKLQAICTVIRQHQKGVKIFVGNILPKVRKTPMYNRWENNFNLVQAVRSINRVIQKVHFLSLHEHFTSSKGKVIKPTHQYFDENGQLTYLGCLTFRECMLREIGVKPYWFK